MIAEILQISNVASATGATVTLNELTHMRPRRLAKHEMMDTETVRTCTILLDKALLELSTGAAACVTFEMSSQIQAELLKVCNSAAVIVKIGKVCEILSMREQVKLQKEKLAEQDSSSYRGTESTTRRSSSSNSSSSSSRKHSIVSQIPPPPMPPAQSPKLAPLFASKAQTPEAKLSPFPTPDYGFFDISEAIDDLVLPAFQSQVVSPARRRTHSGHDRGAPIHIRPCNTGTGLPVVRPVRKNSSGESLDSSSSRSRRKERI